MPLPSESFAGFDTLEGCRDGFGTFEGAIRQFRHRTKSRPRRQGGPARGSERQSRNAREMKPSGSRKQQEGAAGRVLQVLTRWKAAGTVLKMPSHERWKAFGGFEGACLGAARVCPDVNGLGAARVGKGPLGCCKGGSRGWWASRCQFFERAAA